MNPEREMNRRWTQMDIKFKKLLKNPGFTRMAK
jgi:hypothetical protein